MYERIVTLITEAGKSAKSLASKVLTRLIYSPVPISSRQLRQSLVVDKLLQPNWSLESIKEFEDGVIMACAGLVERLNLHEGPEFLRDQPALQLIHLSVKETLIEHYSESAGNTTAAHPRSCHRQFAKHNPLSRTAPGLHA
jgi:hypothetical protein